MRFYQPSKTRPLIIRESTAFISGLETIKRLTSGGHLQEDELGIFFEESHFSRPFQPPGRRLARRDYELYVERFFWWVTADHLRTCATCQKTWRELLPKMQERLREIEACPETQAMIKQIARNVVELFEKKPHNN